MDQFVTGLAGHLSWSTHRVVYMRVNAKLSFNVGWSNNGIFVGRGAVVHTCNPVLTPELPILWLKNIVIL